MRECGWADRGRQLFVQSIISCALFPKRLGVRRFTELSLASLVVMSYGEVGPNVRASARP